MNTTKVVVMGMSCGSCALTVREEVGDIPGVHKVDVDLGSGAVVIESENPVPADVIKIDVEEAGYQLVS